MMAVRRSGWSCLGPSRPQPRRVGRLGLFGLFLQLFQVLQKQVVGARTCKEHPRVGDFELVVGFGQRPVLCRHFVWPVDAVRRRGW